MSLFRILKIATIAIMLWIIGILAWYQSEIKQFELESRLLNDGSTFWALPNTEYSQDYILPEWLISCVDESTSDKFYRITQLDFRIDDLNYAEVNAIRYYAQFKSVHTIKIRNDLFKQEAINVFRSYRNLKTVIVVVNGKKRPACVDLITRSLPGIVVVVQQQNSR